MAAEIEIQNPIGWPENTSKKNPPIKAAQNALWLSLGSKSARRKTTIKAKGAQPLTPK